MMTQTIDEKDEEKLSVNEGDKINEEEIQKRPIYKKMIAWWPIGLKLLQLVSHLIMLIAW